MTEYFAHSTDDQTKSGWQPLDDHLTEVSRRCGEFAARFGAEPWGRVCGVLHDIGKYSQEFQARLEGGHRVDHGTAGARKAVEIFGRRFGRLLAYVVAGHHAGLPDGGVEGGTRRDSLSGRLDPAKVTVPNIREFQPMLEMIVPALPQPPIARTGFSCSFFIRMLFSSLVDADFLDTEAWLTRDRAGLRGGYPTVPELLRQLDQHLDTICRSDAPVNQHRAEILAKCREAALLKPGIFSLTVPTGGGKTLSSLAFALRHAKLHGLERVVYAVPYTSLSGWRCAAG